ncbi:uncharacterized protein LOC119383907 [Rhipicephalus sanguineus]|uniref:uncharacterized protein LOC119383907 n=1 Tax=Rhipicephalus sanguineus TaxID=34632 RepID=UPI0020C34D21|nr:uncharacterized protein LOC119383907 [Rhipicephalus sanguineus]
MAQDPIWDDFLEDVSRMNFKIEDTRPSIVAQKVVESGSIEHSGSRLRLPLHCSESGTRACQLLRLLPTLNELLYVIGAEVTEVAPGRIAVRCRIIISLQYCQRRGPLLLEAVMFLFCIVAKHRCVDTLEFRLQPEPQHDLSPLLCKVLSRLSTLRCFRLEDSHLNNQAACAAFEATTRLLQSQLAELSLSSIQLLGHSEEACASLDAFMVALSETKALKRLKIVNVSFVTKVLEALTNNTSITHLTLDASFAIHGRGESFKRMLASPLAPTDLTIFFHDPSHRPSTDLVFEALKTNETVTKFTAKGFRIGVKACKSLSKFLACNKTIQEISLLDTLWHVRSPGAEPSDQPTIRYHAQHLAAGLGQTESLQRLDLSNEFSVAEIRCIAEAARDAESLKELHFSVIGAEDVEPVSALHQEWLLTGRSRLVGFSVRDEDWEILTKWLTENRHLHSLQVTPYSSNHKVLAKSLVTTLQTNYCVTNIQLEELHLPKADWIRVKNMAQRNYGLVQCAAAFALGSWHKRAAIAYEQVSWHPQLPEVIQCMGSVSKEEAVEKMRQSTFRLRDEFWKLSGIVKEELVCNEPPTIGNGDGTVVQIDKLGDYMLQHVSSYLKVADIPDDEEQDAENENLPAGTQGMSKRKRSGSLLASTQQVKKP